MSASDVPSRAHPRLEVNSPLGRRVVLIDKPVFQLGRRTESDVRSVEVDVSREHAEISLREDGAYVLRDRGSRSGTFVNSEPVTERPLEHRDRIRLGRSESTELVFLLGDTTDSQGTHSSGVLGFRQISSLLDSLRALGPSRVLDDVLELVVDSAIDATGAERGLILLANAGGELEFKIARGRGRITLSGHSFATSQKIPHEVFATGREQIVTDLMDGGLAGDHEGTLALGIRSVLCTPLSVVRYFEKSDAPADQKPIGVLYLDGHKKGHLLSAQSRSALATVASEAASAIESARLYRETAEKGRIEHELQLAAEIQRALLPDADRSGPHFDVAAASMPCRAIGGDFFDYFNLSGSRFGFVLGDVSGKGPPAALMTAMIQGILSTQVDTVSSPAQLMANVNTSLVRRSVQNRFATVLFGALAPDGRLTYCNAGHNPPVLLRRGGIERLDTGGLILGPFPDATYEEETLELEDGDELVVFSDGVTEAFNDAGEEFGEGRLLACLDDRRGDEPADLIQSVLSSVERFVADAGPSDDVTALVLKYRKPS